MTSHLYGQQKPPYVVNLDPAVHNVPYPVNVGMLSSLLFRINTPFTDIRDTVKYKEVMKQHNLGPNGAIMTSLNLFATRFDQVMTLVEKRKMEHEYVYKIMFT
jgi:GTPase SAR1 family protein